MALLVLKKVLNYFVEFIAVLLSTSTHLIYIYCQFDNFQRRKVTNNDTTTTNSTSKRDSKIFIEDIDFQEETKTFIQIEAKLKLKVSQNISKIQSLTR